MSTIKGLLMKPEFPPPPQPDLNSSSLAYLNHLPPGTQPHYLPVQENPPRLRNAPVPDRTLFNPQQDQMDIATGDDTSSPARDASPDHEPGRGLERARSDTSDTETLEHSEPVCKQRRTESPEPVREEPVTASALLSPDAMRAELIQAATDGNLGRLQSLFHHARHLDSIFDETVWRVATQHGHLAVVEWLYGQVDKFGLQKPESAVIFFVAARYGQLRIIQWLASQGCNIHQVNDDNNNALTLAAHGGHLEVVQWLASKGCNIHQVNDGDNNALILAAHGGHLEVVQWLASQGCNIHQVNNDNDNALTLAARSGHLEVVQWLASQRCNILQINKYGNNALINAVEGCSLKLVQYLLGKGCNINHVNSYGRTALSIAMDFRRIDIARYLITQGANVHIGFPPESDGLLFKALDIENPELINLLIPLHDVSRCSANRSTPLMIAAQKNLIEVAVPLIRATAKLPSRWQLIIGALPVATGQLFKELLRNVFFIDDVLLAYSRLSPDGQCIFTSGVIQQYVYSQYDELQHLQASLDSAGTMTTAQMKAAKVGVLAELPVWKLHHPVESLFNEKLPPSLLPIRDKVISFISDDIEVLGAQALQWEQDHLIPVVENLHESCLSHALSAQPTIDITSELTAKGLYHPIAQKIATAWTSAWATVSEEAAPMLKSMGTTHIDRFVNTPVGSGLLQAFRDALRRELDSVGGGILRIEGANLSEESKALYADLIGRQLHLIAQFWRTES